MDISKTREALGTQSLLELLGQIGGFPAIGNFTSSDRWDFQKAMQTAHNVINSEGFFQWSALFAKSSIAIKVI